MSEIPIPGGDPGGRRRRDDRDRLLNECCQALDCLRSALDRVSDRPLLRARIHDAMLALTAVLDEAARRGSDRKTS